jgi:subtilase family serine protease
MNKALLLLAFVAAVSCWVVPAIKSTPPKWTQVGRAHPDQQVNFKIALVQRNTDQLEAALLDVSDPDSPNYGKHWTREQVLDFVSPDPRATARLQKFLSINKIRSISEGDSLSVSSNVAALERVFQTEMYVFQHETGIPVTLATNQYSLPDEFSGLIEFFSGFADLPKVPKAPKVASTSQKAPEYDGISVYPALLRKAYNLPSIFKTNPMSTLCLAEFQNGAFPSSFSVSDVTTFYQGMGVPPVNASAWTFVGPYNPPDNLAEATLDVEYGSIISLNTSIWYWTVNGWIYSFANTLANAKSVPHVVSMSWGWPEPWECSNGTGTCPNGETAPVYVQRVDNEFKKAGLRGISLLAASGDQGAPGDENSGCSNSDKPLSDIFPGGSPWVLSVGATMLLNPSTTGNTIPQPPVCSQLTCAESINETACSIPAALITSGGGFVAYNTRPSWQAGVVNAYLKSGVTLPPKKYYNATNRAFPDVSALGHGFPISWNGQWQGVDGTSASTPVFAAIVSLLNSHRLNSKKSVLGYLNPVMYKAYETDPTTFHDITTGNNFCTEYCCATYGYYATKGWDPLTGLGTPNFPKLLSYINRLP